MTFFVRDGKKASELAVPPVGIPDGGTGEVTANAALAALGGINIPDHNAIDHRLNPHFLLDAAAHNLIDHSFVAGVVTGAYQLQVARADAIAVTTHTFVPGFTPLLGIAFIWTGAASQQQYTGFFTGPASNTTIGQSPFGPVGLQVASLASPAGEIYQCTSFTSADVTVARTVPVGGAVDMVLVVLG